MAARLPTARPAGRTARPAGVVARPPGPDLVTVVVLVWLLIAALDTAFASLGGGLAAPGTRLVYEAAWALTWTVVTLALGPWRRWLLSRDWPLAGRVAAHGAALAAAGVLDAAVRRAVSGALSGPPAVPFGATLLYFADVTTLAWLLALALDRVRETNRRLVDQTRHELALRAQLAQARLEQLQGQMQPHFLFNALGMAGELLHDAPHVARRVLAELATLVRSTVEDRREMVTLREELTAVRAYVDIQRLRHADWLTIDEDVDPAALDVTLVRFVLQPLVENAIRHGLAGRAAPGTIHIGARLDGDRLVLRVADNGVGLSKGGGARGWGIGLASVRRRLEVAYGSAQRLTLVEHPGGGTVAEVVLSTRGTSTLGTRHSALGPATAPPSAECRVPSPDVPSGDGRVPSGDGRVPAFAMITAAWLLWALLWTQQSLAYDWLRGRLGQRDLGDVVLGDLAAALIWAALTPVALGLARTIARRAWAWPVSALAHVAVATGFAAAHSAAWEVVRTGALGRWPAGSGSTMALSAAVYGLLVCLAYQRQLRDWLRERELAAARLRMALAEAPLDRATTSLREVALARRLEEIAARPALDIARAERELAELAAELRAILDASVGAAGPAAASLEDAGGVPAAAGSPAASPASATVAP